MTQSDKTFSDLFDEFMSMEKAELAAKLATRALLDQVDAKHGAKLERLQAETEALKDQLIVAQADNLEHSKAETIRYWEQAKNAPKAMGGKGGSSRDKVKRGEARRLATEYLRANVAPTRIAVVRAIRDKVIAHGRDHGDRPFTSLKQAERTLGDWLNEWFADDMFKPKK